MIQIQELRANIRMQLDKLPPEDVEAELVDMAKAFFQSRGRSEHARDPRVPEALCALIAENDFHSAGHAASAEEVGAV